jgi:CDP-diacylglycerol--glycerol-3-phosphate 3-phosphatidyltransferase
MVHALPNLLTSFRLVAAPGVALVFAGLPRPTADLIAFGLFVLAAATDWLDGWLARRLGAISAYGRMMDPIADKAMVMIALAVLMMLTGPNPLMIVPAAAIMLREVAVSGLREFLAGRVEAPVTRLAKWKTTVQMIAIGALLLAGWATEREALLFHQLGPETFFGILEGSAPDPHGLAPLRAATPVVVTGGFALLWIAAAMTIWTGVGYFRRALAHPAAKEA